MLVFEDTADPPDLTSSCRAGLNSHVSSAFAGYQIIRRNGPPIGHSRLDSSFRPIRSLMALGGIVEFPAQPQLVNSQQYPVPVAHSVARTAQIIRRVKAFFFSQKVDGRNAP